jgi:Putative transposase/Transposase zinc-binding domain
MRTAFSLAQVISNFGEDFNTITQATPYIQKTFRAINRCRTANMGGHVDVCSQPTCQHIRISYNSCRNRHCPSCQSTKKEQWISRMHYRTLPVTYFHGVFTVPHEFNGLCLRYPELMYELLFKVVWATINECSKHPQYGVQKTGMTAILHTWGQNLSLHPHLHCIIPAGGLSNNTSEGLKWKKLKGNNTYSEGAKKTKKTKDFLYPIDQLKSKYKAKFMAALRKLIKLGLIEKQEDKFLDMVYNKNWVVYAKTPFAGPKQVIEYLGRYTHKVAISNHRIQDINAQEVTFAYKDYNDKGKTKSMKLEGVEFLRRISQHILPKGFTKIRHFGLHSGSNQHIMDALYENFHQQARPAQVRETWQQIAFRKTEFIENQCPKCHQNSLQTRAVWLVNRPPPEKYMSFIVNTL